MSATPEVAFEAIVKTEYSMIENKRNNVVRTLREMNAKREKQISNTLDDSFNMFVILNSKNQSAIKDIRQKLYERNFGIVPFPEEVIQKEINKYFLEIDFYYMPRDYNYIEKIIPYKTTEELLEFIKSSHEKWMIFVYSENEGTALKNELIESNIVNSNECIFISRSKIQRDSVAEEEYNFIIDEETLSKRIVITTCVLDNGINIKNTKDTPRQNKILNIAINSYDRTQFIQMLGRVRDNQTDKVKLYIQEFSVDKLKQFLNRDAEALIRRLYNDLCSLDMKKNNFDNKLFFVSPDPEKFSEYNPCAIYQLIDNMSRMLRIIRNSDKEFFIHVSEKLDLLKEKIYQFYREHIYYSWSRNIVELLETEVHRKEKEKLITFSMEHKLDWKRYNNKLDDTFTRYLFSDLLPRYFLYSIEMKFNEYYQKIKNINDRNRYDALSEEYIEENLKNKSDYYSKATVLYKKCELLKKEFRDTFIDVSLNFIQDFSEKIKHYEHIANDIEFDSFLAEQLNWLEKSIDDCYNESESNLLDSDEELPEFIKSHAITEDELQKHIHTTKNGKKSDYIEGAFLKKYGFQKEGKYAYEISRCYFNGKSLSQVINEIITIDEVQYKLISKNEPSNKHITYYLFIKSE